MSKQTRWLNAEIERWVEEKIISADQAGLIRARYAAPAGALSWGLIVFFGLGATIVGLGVILLFAYNWDDIPKFGKLALIFGAIVAGHAAGLALRAKGGWRAQMGEALSVFGTMAFGAGIWLVAQVYHIDEHFPNGFLIWALGALAMAWALDSLSHGLMAAVLFAIWGGSEAIAFDAPADVSALAIVVGLGPLVWRLRSALLLAVALAALYWLLLCSAGHWDGSVGVFSNAFALSVLLIAATKLMRDADTTERQRGVLGFYGWTGFVVCAFILSFDDAAGAVLRWQARETEAGVAFVYRWLLFILAAAAWIALAMKTRRGARGLVRPDQWLCPIALCYAQGLMFLDRHDDVFVAVVFNLVCLATAAAWMMRGCREANLRLTVLGSVLLAVIVFARYFDLFDSLAARGLAFVAFGAVLFAEGFYYRKLRRAETEGGAA